MHSPFKRPKRHRPEVSTMSSGDSAAATPTPVSFSVFTPVAAPVLNSVNLLRVARFLKEPEQYETEICAKQAEGPSLKSLLYTESIDRTLLRLLFLMGTFDSLESEAASPKDLGDAHIKAFVESLFSHTGTYSFDPTIIGSAFSSFVMLTKTFNSDARITTFCVDFLGR